MNKYPYGRWVVYELYYGPGHQSHSTKYEYWDASWFEDDEDYSYPISSDAIEEVFKSKIAHTDQATGFAEWIDRPPDDYLRHEIELMKARVASDQHDIEMYTALLDEEVHNDIRS